MSNNILRRLTFLVLLVCAATASRAADAGVRDDGHFFSTAAINRANETIAQIKRDHGKEVVVETYSAIPDDLARLYTPDRKDEFFAKWVSDRTKALGLDGVYVLVSKEPSRVQVGVGGETRQRAFTVADRDRVRDVLVTAFRDRQFDEGLTQSVALAQQTFDRNMGTARGNGSSAQSSTATPSVSPVPAPSSPTSSKPASSGPNWLMLALIGIGVIIVFNLLKRVMSQARSMPGPTSGQHQQPPPGPYNYGGTGGGGFGRGMMGGLLGGMLGGWMQDRWSRRSEHDPNAALPPDSTSASSGGIFNDPRSSYPSDQGNDFSSSGGDFGGGDSGGGDSGSSGGDF